MKKKRQKEAVKDLKVNPELEGLSIDITSLGEIHSNLDIDKINDFLDKNVEDKKLK